MTHARRQWNDRFASREAKAVRDKTAILLKACVDEVNSYGRFVFWRDPRRRKGYTSAYNRAKKQRRRDRRGRPEKNGTPRPARGLINAFRDAARISVRMEA